MPILSLWKKIRPSRWLETKEKTGEKASEEKADLSKEATRNELIAKTLMDKLNAHECALSLFHPRAEWLFPEASMTVTEYFEEQKSILASFPDFHLAATSAIKEQQDGSVSFHVRGRGTHTGAPYGFGPYPILEAKGVRCQNDPE